MEIPDTVDEFKQLLINEGFNNFVDIYIANCPCLRYTVNDSIIDIFFEWFFESYLVRINVNNQYHTTCDMMEQVYEVLNSYGLCDEIIKPAL